MLMSVWGLRLDTLWSLSINPDCHSACKSAWRVEAKVIDMMLSTMVPLPTMLKACFWERHFFVRLFWIHPQNYSSKSEKPWFRWMLELFHRGLWPLTSGRKRPKWSFELAIGSFLWVSVDDVPLGPGFHKHYLYEHAHVNTIMFMWMWFA